MSHPDCHPCRCQFLHQNLECGHVFVLRSLLRCVQVAQLRQRPNTAVVSEVSKHCAAYTPLCAIEARSLKFLFPLEIGFFSCLSVDDFMETSEDVATRDVLKRETSLDQKTSVWNLYWLPFPLTGPDR